MIAKSSNPYVGPRTFERDEADKFFGREREAQDVLALATTEQLVLFYAQSGAGKSSLINTRLIPGLEEEGFEVLPVGRVGGAPQMDIENVFAYNLMVTLDARSQADPKRYADLSLKEFLSGLVSDDGRHYYYESGSEESVDETGEEDGYESWPRTLIIDQFEEILTENLSHWQKRADFFVQLREAMADDPDLWVILVLREDFVASLEPYAYLMPGRFRARYYMQRMSYSDALKAVTYPVREIRPFADGVAEKLVENLRQVRLSSPQEDGKPVYGSSQYIEPVQLQVACYQLWASLPPLDQLGDKESCITDEDLRRLTGGGSLNVFIDRALGQFYDDAVADVTREGRSGQTAYEVRDWFEKKLITEAGTRALVLKGPNKTESMANSVVEELERRFLLRYQTRAGSGWYELVHDRFVEPILEANAAWREQQPLVRVAQEWDWAGRPDDKLYRGDSLLEAQKDPNAQVEIVQEFLQAGAARESEALEKRKQQQRRAAWAVGSILVIGVIVTIAVLSLFLQTTTDQRDAANQANTRAAVNLVELQTAEAQTFSNLGIAQTAQADTADALATVEAAQADTSRALDVAATAQAEAEANLEQLLASNLANNANNYSVTSPERALLLAREASDVVTPVSVDVKGTLLKVLEAGGAFDAELMAAYPLSSTLQVAGQRQLNRTAVSQDGRFIAVGDFAGQITLWDMSGVVPVSQTLSAQSNPIFGLTFSPDGRWLASSTGEDFLFNRSSSDQNSVVLWDLEQTPPRVETLVEESGSFWDVAFSPNGQMLAVGQSDGNVTLWDLTDVNPTESRILESDSGDWLYTVAFSPDGQTLAGGSRNRTVVLWDLTSDNPKPANEVRGHSAWVNDVVFSPDGRWLATGGDDGQVILYDGGEGWKLEYNRNLGPAVLSLAFSRDGRILVAGDSSGQVRLLALREPDEFVNSYWLSSLDALENDDQVVRAVAFRGDELLWTTYQAVFELRRTLIADQAPLFAADEALQNLAAIDGDRLILTDLETEQIQTTSVPGARAAAMSGDGFYLYLLLPYVSGEQPAAGDNQDAGSESGDNTDSAPSDSGNGSDPEPLAEAALEPDCAENPGQIERISLADGLTERQRLTGCYQIELLAVSPDGRRLATANGAKVTIWSFGPDGLLVPGLSTDDLNDVTALAFGADSDMLVAADSSFTVTIWDLSGGRFDEQATITDSQAVTLVALNEDGSRLATAGWTTTVRVWDVESGRLLGSLAPSSLAVVDLLTFSNGGERLTAVSAPMQIVNQWPVAFASWQDLACETAGRNLTNTEWEDAFAGREEGQSFELVPLGDDVYEVEVHYRATCDGFPWHSSVVEAMIADAREELDEQGVINTAAAEALFAEAASRAPLVESVDIQLGDARSEVLEVLLQSAQEALSTGKTTSAEFFLTEAQAYAPELDLDVEAVLEATELVAQIGQRFNEIESYDDIALQDSLTQLEGLVSTMPAELNLKAELIERYYSLCNRYRDSEPETLISPCVKLFELSDEVELPLDSVEEMISFGYRFWRFEGQAGQVLEVESKVLSADGNLRFTLRQADWEETRPLTEYPQGDATIRKYVLPENGSYFLVASSSAFDWRKYRVSIDLRQPQLLALGETLAGVFADNEIWAFTGERSQAIDIVVEARNSSTEVYLTAWQLDGSPVSMAYYAGPQGSVEAQYVILPEDGTYFLRPQGSASQDSYIVTITEPEIAELPPDQKLDSDPVDLAVWRFDGQAGDFVQLSMAITGTTSYVADLVLFDPMGVSVAYGNYRDNGFELVMGPTRLPETGVYTLISRSYAPVDMYTAMWTRLPIAEVDLAQAVTADFGENIIWHLEGSADSFATVELRSAGQQEVNLQVYDPEGQMVGSDFGAEPNLPVIATGKSGRYAIVITGAESGRYTLDVSAVEPQEIALNSTDSGSFDQPEVWWFEGTAGQVVQIYHELENTQRVAVQLISPGNEMNLISYANANYLYVLPEDGRYAIVPTYQNSSEPYTLYLQEGLIQTIELVEKGDSETVSGDLFRPLVWVFEARYNQYFTISLFPLGEEWFPYVYVYDADGTLLESRSGSNTGLRFFLTAPATGTYYIFVGTGGDLGAYDLELREDLPKG